MSRITQQTSSFQSGTSQGQYTVQRTSGNVTSDIEAERELFLRYARSGDAIVYSGNSDYGILSGLRDAILQLKTDYFSRTGSVTFKAEERDDLDKRFLLFEHELDGLLRRRI